MYTAFGKSRVVIYARVSTEHEAQLSALENQIDWYKPILEARPEWVLAGHYIDEGITGTRADKRIEFQRMMKLGLYLQEEMEGELHQSQDLHQRSS